MIKSIVNYILFQGWFLGQMLCHEFGFISRAYEKCRNITSVCSMLPYKTMNYENKLCAVIYIIGIIIFMPVIPMLVWFLFKWRSKFINWYGREIINFQLSMYLLYMFLLFISGLALRFKVPFNLLNKSINMLIAVVFIYNAYYMIKGAISIWQDKRFALPKWWACLGN